MKILHLIPSLSPLRGGTTEAVWGMSQALIREKVNVEIVATNDHGPGLSDWATGVLQERRGVPVRVFPRWSPTLSALREYQYSSQLGQWLHDHIDEYDAIHTHVLFSYVPTMGMRLARMRRIPYLNSPSGLLCEWSMRQQYHKKLAYWKIFEQANLRSAACMHFTSKNEQAESADWTSKQTRQEVVPLGCHIESADDRMAQAWRERLGVDCGKVLLLFLGRIHPKKGLELLFDALSGLGRFDWSLAIAGSGDPLYLQRMRQLLKNRNLENKVLWVDFVEGVEKAALLRSADFFVLTSHAENFGITVVEALHCGTPVLVTEGVALASEVVELGLGYASPLSVDQIADKLRMVMEEVTVWRSRREEILRRAASVWTWAICAKRLKGLYENILENQKDYPIQK